MRSRGDRLLSASIDAIVLKSVAPSPKHQVPEQMPCPGAGELLCRIASSRRSRTNVDRNLRRCIHKAGVTLDLDLELVETTIKLRKPKNKCIPIYWPCFSMRSWMSTLSTSFPHYMLGGFDLEQEFEWRSLFRWFWNCYREYDSSHPIFSEDCGDCDYSLCCPIMTHGDEGRGLRSSPFMVQSFQFVISHLGPFTTNTSGYLVLN